MRGALTAVALGIALILCGAGFGSPSLLVPGVGLVGLALGAWIWVGLARPQRLLRDPGPRRIVEGEPYPLRLRAEGARLPPPGGAIAEPLLARPLPVGPRWDGTVTQTVELRGRGRRSLEPPRLELRDPLGLCVTAVEGDDGGELLVLPRVEPVMVAGRGEGGSRASALAGLDDGAGGRPQARAIELEVDGLRAYREGSPASRIHWPAVARSGELIERRLVAGSDSTSLVALDASDPVDERALDAAVRAAASLSFALGAAQGCAVLLGGDRRPTAIEPDLRSWPQLHARLALVEAGGRPPALTRAARAGVVFWVTAAARPALPNAMRVTGSGYVVAPAGGGLGHSGGPPAFTVAGCEGRAVGAVGAGGRRPARRAVA